MSGLKLVGTYNGVPIYGYPDLSESIVYPDMITHAAPTARGLGALADRTEAGPPWLCQHVWEVRPDLGGGLVCRFCHEGGARRPHYHP